MHQQQLRKIPHSPYSPDIIPSDFYVFSTVKQHLQIYQGRSFEELQENVHEILDFIESIELALAMLPLIARL
jgi:hypothetical protein